MHICMFTHSLNKHTHINIYLLVQILSSSCSFLLGTLKPVHVSQCPSLWTPLSPSLSFCHISCISASLPHFSLIFLHSPHSVFGVCYLIFHHVTVNKVKCRTPFILLRTPPPLLHHRPKFYLLSTCVQPFCNTVPFFFLSLKKQFSLLRWWDICDDLSACLLWEPWSLWSVPLLSNKDAFDSLAPWKSIQHEYIMMWCHVRSP